jgi:hypothetical protein
MAWCPTSQQRSKGWCKPSRGLAARAGEAATFRRAKTERHECLSQTNCAAHAVEHGHRDTVGYLARKPGKRPATNDDHLGIVLLDRPLARLDERLT